MLCELVSKTRLSDTVYDFVIECPEMARQTKAGQFLHILCGGTSYLRRPISVCDVIGGRRIRFVFEVRGSGTQELAQRRIGDHLDVLGPLGNGFSLDKAGDQAVLLVGGGIGVFPLLKLAKDLSGRATALLGFRSREAIVLADAFTDACKNVFLATDDGSCGHHGFVTDIMENIVRTNPVSMIYICGPKPMMARAAGIAKQQGIPAEASMEERMGCGVGACVTCTCTVGGVRKRVCKDGPVFDAAEVEFDG